MSQKVLQILGIVILLALGCWGVNALVTAFALPHIVATVIIIVAVIIALLFLGRLIGLWT
jgi:hypothetical protein